MNKYEGLSVSEMSELLDKKYGKGWDLNDILVNHPDDELAQAFLNNISCSG